MIITIEIDAPTIAGLLETHRNTTTRTHTHVRNAELGQHDPYPGCVDAAHRADTVSLLEALRRADDKLHEAQAAADREKRRADGEKSRADKATADLHGILTGPDRLSVKRRAECECIADG